MVYGRDNHQERSFPHKRLLHRYYEFSGLYLQHILTPKLEEEKEEIQSLGTFSEGIPPNFFVLETSFL